MGISLFRHPKIRLSGGHKDFWKQIGMIIIGTTISLVFTVWASTLLDKRQRAKDRRLSALMVMGNIEEFAQSLETIVKKQSHSDSLCTWLLAAPIDELEKIPKNELTLLVNEAVGNGFIVYDKTAESIFSNNIETWKNMGNFQFIASVGSCFNRMHSIEEYWNTMVKETDALIDKINNNPEQYPGKYNCTKWLRDPGVRNNLALKHNWLCWLSYQAEYMRYCNRQNMAVMDISQKELDEFMKEYQKEIEIEEKEPDQDKFYTPTPRHDSISSLKAIQDNIAKMKRGK